MPQLVQGILSLRHCCSHNFNKIEHIEFTGQLHTWVADLPRMQLKLFVLHPISILRYQMIDKN